MMMLCMAVLSATGEGERRQTRPGHEKLVRLPDLGKLTLEQAWRLDGVRTKFCVVLMDNGYRVGEHDIYGCVSRDDEIERTVCLAAGPEKKGVQLVEGMLRVLQHRARVIGQTGFVGFTECRLYVQEDHARE
jgi:hypothetical protein